jgi:Flp pilus assembly pilin Flp
LSPFGGWVGKEESMSLSHAVRRFISNEEGTETLEWGLVCGLLVVGAIAAIALIGPKVTAMWTNVNSKIP